MPISRYQVCEQIARLVYGEQPSDNSSVTIGLISQYVTEGLGIAAKQCYKDSVAIDGVAYVNNSFTTTFKGLAVAQYDQFTYQITLPDIPLGIGRNEGVTSLVFVDGNGNVSQDAIPISEYEVALFRGVKRIPNKTLYYPEGAYLYAISNLLLNTYTARVKMISGADSLINMDLPLNCPPEYLPVIKDWVVQKLILERGQPQQQTNEGNTN